MEMDLIVKRLHRSRHYEALKSLVDNDQPGMASHADLMHACLGLAGAIIDDHPDLDKESSTVLGVALELFRSYEGPVKDLPPGRESGEE